MPKTTEARVFEFFREDGSDRCGTKSAPNQHAWQRMSGDKDLRRRRLSNGSKSSTEASDGKANIRASLSRVIELLQGKWTVQILCAMRERPKRLSELRRAIPAASKKALTASLRSLEAAQIVLRRDLSSSVLHVEYEIADTMREPLSALLDHLAEWSKSYSLNGAPRNSVKS